MADPHVHNSGTVQGLIAQLEEITPLVAGTVPIPGTPVEMAVMHPASIDPLLDAAGIDPEENLPYWAEVWPSGIALAGEILRHPECLRGLHALELGCGVGITAAAAMMAGARLVATDYSPHSLALTALTCLRNHQMVPSLRQVNWRADDADLLQSNGAQWPLVLAADVLYERRDIEPILAVLERIVAPGGSVWLAEPGRHVAHTAVDLARSRGWCVNSHLWSGPWHGANHVEGTVTVHKMVKPGHR